MHIFAALLLLLFLILTDGFDSDQTNSQELQILRSSQTIDQSLLSGRSSRGNIYPDSDGLLDVHEYMKTEKYKSTEQEEPRCILQGRSIFPYLSVNISKCSSRGKCCACHNPWMSKAPCCGKRLCNRYGIFDLTTTTTTTTTTTPKPIPTIKTSTSSYYPEPPPRPQPPYVNPNVNYNRCTCRVPGGYYAECLGNLCAKPCCACDLRPATGLPCCGGYTCSKYGITQGQNWGYP